MKVKHLLILYVVIVHIIINALSQNIIDFSNVDFSRMPQPLLGCVTGNAQQQSISTTSTATCTGTSSPAFDFTPNASTSVKKFRLNFIFMQKDDGTGGFQETDPEHQKFINDVINVLNWKMLNLTQYPVGNSCYESNNIANTKIQFVVNKKYFRDSYGQDNRNGTGNSLYAQFSYFYLDYLDDLLVSSATGDDVGLNIFFTENGSGAGTGGGNSTQPSYDLNAFIRVQEVNWLIEFLSKKYDIPGSTGFPNAYWNPNESWGYNNTYNNTYWWVVDVLSSNLRHEIVHCFDSERVHTCDCNNVMYGSGCSGGQGGSFLHAYQLAKIQKAVYLQNVRKYVKDNCTYNTTTQTINTNTTWDFNIQLYSNLEVTSNSTLTNTCKIYMPCSSLVHIASGSSLILDQGLLHLAPNAFLLVEGTLIIKSGGRLELSELSWCEAKNNGNIIIEDGGEIVIYRGSKLVIQPTGKFDFQNKTPNKGILFSSTPSAAVEPFVEIRGTLTIADYADFTFSGNGFIRFGLPYNAGGASNILTGPSSKITLQGNSRNDKIAEILDYTYILPNWDGTTGFIIRDGTVLLGNNAYIRTANTKFIFTNASFLKLNVNKHGGIRQGGCYAPIDNILVDGAIRGISANLSTCQGSPLYVSNSIFQNCDIGIYTYNKGGIFNNVKLLNNTIGWQADAPVFKSTMNNCEANNNLTGVFYNGGAGSSLYISGTVMNYNSSAAVNVTNVEAKIRCAHFLYIFRSTLTPIAITPINLSSRINCSSVIR